MTVITPLDVPEIARTLDEQGYAVIRGVVGRENLDRLHAALVEAYERAPRMRGGGSLTGHLNCYPGVVARPVWEELEAAGVVDAIHRIREGKPNHIRVTTNYNLPHSVAQHYHMDGFYTDDFLVCNVAVVDTDLRNGAIDMLPGTNRTFLKFWKYAVQRTYRRSTRLPMRAGDVLLRTSMTWHRGMPNHTDRARPLLSFTFGEVSAPVDEDPFLQHGGEVRFFPNWYSTSKLGELRERVYRAAPVTYAAYRFVRSLWGNKGYSPTS